MLNSEAFVPDEAWLESLANESYRRFMTWQASRAAESSRADIRTWMHRIARFHQRRLFSISEQALSIQHPLGRWLAQVFLSFRDKYAMMDYLRFQECAYVQENNLDPLRELSAMVLRIGGSLGRSPAAAVRLGFSRRLSISISLDPLVNLRSIYCRLLKSHRQRVAPTRFVRCLNWLDRQRARLNVFLLERGAGWYLARVYRQLQRDPHYVPVAIFQEINRLLLETFPEESREGRLDRMAVVSEALNFLLPRLLSLHTAIPNQLEHQGSVGKLMKLFMGVLIGRMENLPSAPVDVTQYVIDSVKLAYCWACTYPLVDDILDERTTGDTQRRELVSVMRSVCEDDPIDTRAFCAASRELYARMGELFALIPEADRPAARAAILNVFRAHCQDSQHTISSADAPEYQTFFRVALLKSMLVRTATMHVCGIPPSEQDYREMASIAYFNQLGDDIWDARQDYEAGSVTPATLALAGRGPNASLQYMDFAAYLCTMENKNSARPAALAIAHTFRLAWQAGNDVTRQAIAEAMQTFAPDVDVNNFFGATQHIDPDSMIFDLEDSLAKSIALDKDWKNKLLNLLRNHELTREAAAAYHL